MRRKAIVAWSLAAAAVMLGYIGRAASVDAFYLLSGMAFLTAIGIALSYLPVWGGFRNRVPAMPGLFPRVKGDDWDPVTGRSK